MPPRVRLIAARKRLALVGRWPSASRSTRPSLVFPVTQPPSQRLLDVALAAADRARSVDLGWLSARVSHNRPDVWPGQHYKLLSALVATLAPRTIVEIGTAHGLSALAMKAELPAEGSIVTFDLRPWQQYPGRALREEDFADGRLQQRLDDLSQPAGWRENAELLRSAELIFLDAKHDGEQERAIMRGFEEVRLQGAPIVVLDDIRLWRMISFWQGIGRPKLDLTSFGHWSGTGLVDFA